MDLENWLEEYMRNMKPGSKAHGKGSAGVWAPGSKNDEEKQWCQILCGAR
jgi:hypothetical protein